MWRTYFTYMTLIKEKAAEKPALVESVLARKALTVFFLRNTPLLPLLSDKEVNLYHVILVGI